MRSTTRNLTLAVALAALTACGGGNGGDTTDAGGATSGADGSGTVTLSDFAIDAPESVPSGTTLTVVNEGDVAHTFTAEEGADFDTGNLDGGEEGSVTVHGSGTVSYVCTLHPGQMTGSFEVADT